MGAFVGRNPETGRAGSRGAPTHSAKLGAGADITRNARRERTQRDDNAPCWRFTMSGEEDRDGTSCDQAAASEQVAARLSTTVLVRSPPHHYRNRMVYDLRADGASGCELSLPTVWEARCVVYRWAVEASGMRSRRDGRVEARRMRGERAVKVTTTLLL